MVLHHWPQSPLGILQPWKMFPQTHRIKQANGRYSPGLTDSSRERCIFFFMPSLSCIFIFYHLLFHTTVSDCKDGNGATYRGPTSMTVLGVTCQAWSAQSPHRHSSFTPASHPDKGLEGNVSMLHFIRGHAELLISHQNHKLHQSFVIYPLLPKKRNMTEIGERKTP